MVKMYLNLRGRLLTLVTVLLCGIQLQALAQTSVSGRVTSRDDGSGLPGVSVLVKGTAQGTTSDVEGRFSLSVPGPESVLVISFVGFNTQEIRVGNRTTIDVSLSENAQALDELIVVGYSTVKRRELVGSVSRISAEEIAVTKSLNFTDALQGKASGVAISNTSGTPGAPIRVDIRGVNSINSGTQPLWIIDGMPVFTESIGRNANTVAQNPLASINPNDIESVEILKDAAATAVYGSRGSNGVILVTTKSGKSGKGSVNVDFSSGISDLAMPIERMGLANTAEWVQIADRARVNSGRAPFLPNDVMNANYRTPLTREQALATNTDWASIALRRGSFRDLNASISQGNDKATIFASLNYRTDEGINVGNDLSRISGRLNVNATPLPRLNVGTRLNVSYIENYRTKEASANPGAGAGGVGSFASVVRSGLPWFPVFDENHPSGFWNPGAGNLALATRRDLILDTKDQYRALGNIHAEYALPFVEGLSFRTEGSFDMIQDNATNWASSTVSLIDESFAYEGAITAKSINYNAFLKYNRVFGENRHNFNVVAGTESQLTSQYNREMEARNLVGYNQELGAANPGLMTRMTGFMDGERYLRSYFGRVNYLFLDKYILGGSIRRDGSSAFASEHRWGTFAALSAGWIISDENFFQGLRQTVSLLKLRGSFGQTGNQSIPNNRNITILNNNSNERYGPPSAISAGTTYNVGNRAITWEKTDSYDVGFDYGFLNNRISGSVAYYMQKVQDMLLQVSTPPSAGINNIFSNVGDMDNWGVEFNVSSVNVNTRGFEWRTDFNFTTNRNEIRRLTPAMEAARGATLFVGGRLGLYKMADYAGIDPERGVHMIHEFDRAKFEESGEVIYTGRQIPFTDANSMLYEVVHKDKSSIPTFYGGINNSFTYKGFDLSVFFHFSGGNWIYNDYERTVTNVANSFWNLKRDMLTDSWEPGRTDARYPLLFVEGGAPATTAWDANAIDPNTGLRGWWRNPDINNLAFPNARETYDKNGGRPLSKNLERGDFLRLRTVALGYNLPARLIDPLRMQNLRVYVTGNNLWTLTKFTGWDPETSNPRSNPNQNLMQSSEAGNTAFTPMTRNYSAGISITF